MYGSRPCHANSAQGTNVVRGNSKCRLRSEQELSHEHFPAWSPLEVVEEGPPSPPSVADMQCAAACKAYKLCRMLRGGVAQLPSPQCEDCVSWWKVSAHRHWGCTVHRRSSVPSLTVSTLARVRMYVRYTYQFSPLPFTRHSMLGSTRCMAPSWTCHSLLQTEWVAIVFAGTTRAHTT